MKTTYKHYTINAEYTGSKASPWHNDKMPENWNHHRVTVYNTKTKARCSFDFWASIAEPELRKAYDVRSAFYCFVSDALSGKECFEEFCSSLGYDSDSITALKTFNACERALQKAERVIDGDLYDFANELQEIAG
jgi:hypothetical protein